MTDQSLWIPYNSFVWGQQSRTRARGDCGKESKGPGDREGRQYEDFLLISDWSAVVKPARIEAPRAFLPRHASPAWLATVMQNPCLPRWKILYILES